jgi:epoxyqueuosine reductase
MNRKRLHRKFAIDESTNGLKKEHEKMLVKFANTQETVSFLLDFQWGFLKESVTRLGFAAIGAVPAGAIHPRAAGRLQSWVANGYHATMEFMSRTIPQRLNVNHRGILEDANIVLVAALPYGDGVSQQGLWQYIARHARGIDYHITLKQRLELLAQEVSKRFPGCRYRVFTDSAPLSERFWGAAAGIGTVGRSGALLVPKYGPKVLIGEIVFAQLPIKIAEPAPLEPFRDCIGCTACVDACPTGAIVGDGIVDSNRCLSYWTVERRQTSMPGDIEERVSAIFGCDRCTAVCPKAVINHCMLDLPLTDAVISSMDLDMLLCLDQTALIAAFHQTALCRLGWDNLRRNADLMIKVLNKEPCV